MNRVFVLLLLKALKEVFDSFCLHAEAVGAETVESFMCTTAVVAR